MTASALTTWTLNPAVIALLLFLAGVYLRGWLRIRKLVRREEDGSRLAAFCGGLLVLFLANESPLDAFDGRYLSAHMTQHLLLLMIAPALLSLGHPMVPLLRGLPKRFVRSGIAPLLTWPLLRKWSGRIVTPPVALSLFAVSTIGWHLPATYELALSSPVIHAAQHASFFWTGILFWWPVIRPSPRRGTWPLWAGIPYLLFADLLNTIVAAFLIFSDHLIYPSYSLVPGAQNDQVLAGAIMWVPGSIAYLLPAVVIAVHLLSPRRSPPKPLRIQRSIRN